LIENSVTKCFWKDKSNSLFSNVNYDEIIQDMRYVLLKALLTFDMYKAASAKSTFFTYFYRILLTFKAEFAKKVRSNHFFIYFPSYLVSKNLIVDIDCLSKEEYDKSFSTKDDTGMSDMALAVSQSDAFTKAEKDILTVIAEDADCVKDCAIGKRSLNLAYVSKKTGLTANKIKFLSENTIPEKLIAENLVSNSFEIELMSRYSKIDDDFIALDDLLMSTLSLDTILSRAITSAEWQICNSI
jgi:hypothetical protein